MADAQKTPDKPAAGAAAAAVVSTAAAEAAAAAAQPKPAAALAVSDIKAYPTVNAWRCCGHALYTRALSVQCPACAKALGADSCAASFMPPFGPPRGRALCVRMSVGKLTGYSAESLLHIGISDSKGCVASFDEAGRRADSVAVWGNESLSVRIALPAMDDAAWDAALAAYLKAEQAMAPFKPYHALRNNCYTFAIGFLNEIKWQTRANHTKEQIAAAHIGPAVDALTAFLALSATLNDSPVLRVHNINTSVLLAMPPVPPAVAVVCDGCGAVIAKHRSAYRCGVCADFDLCVDCFDAGAEPEQHKRTHKLTRRTVT